MVVHQPELALIFSELLPARNRFLPRILGMAAKKKKGRDLHGSAPDKCAQALILIDVINAMEFPEGKKLLKHALPAAKKIAALKTRAKEAGVPVIYVNDNFGKWRSDFQKHVEYCLQDDAVGRQVVELLQPDEDDYFVLKPKHSGFFSTTLDILLRYLEVRELILTGYAGNLCVLHTANDAFMRDFELTIPRDCIASESGKENDHAVRHMKKHLRASVGLSQNVKLSPGI